ncbi:MAG: transcription termination factor NusA [Chloroflexota bacterium]|nr:transcription termination factor NusA [Chloroflexota bacterium]
MGKTKSEFMLAITQLAAEKNLPKEVVLEAVESALASAFRKNNFAPNQSVSAKLNPETGQVSVFAGLLVVEEATSPTREISLEDARRINKYAQLNEEIMVEATPQNAGRIAAQTAKQVVLQRLREAEREIVFEEFSDRENEIVTGIVQRIEPRQITLDLGRTEGILPSTEQVRMEHYRSGQRVKVYILGVHRTAKGPQIVVSRTHHNLLRRLLELEVPEIHQGAIELKSIAREAGQRSKVAVAARQEGIDPIGSCVGLRGIRIQNIVNELSGEKIDVVEWDADPALFIANALSPAQVENVAINTDENVAVVVVPDRQLSLAIGREGQNARLAAKLTGWRIDIKSTSVAEAEKQATEKTATDEIEETAEEIAVPEAFEEVEFEEPGEAEELQTFAEAEEAAPDEAMEIIDVVEPVEEELAVPAPEEFASPYEKVKEAPQPTEPHMPVIRFAEDILLPSRVPKPAKKGKKGKGKAKEEETAKASPKPKVRRAADIRIDEAELDLALPIERELPPEEEIDIALRDDILIEAASKPAKKVKKNVKGKTKDKKGSIETANEVAGPD